MNYLQLKIKALEDWDYITENYGNSSFHDNDDDALRNLLINTNNETALKIILKWIKEVITDGVTNHGGHLEQLPEDDPRIKKIIKKWKSIIEELGIY